MRFPVANEDSTVLDFQNSRVGDGDFEDVGGEVFEACFAGTHGLGVDVSFVSPATAGSYGVDKWGNGDFHLSACGTHRQAGAIDPMELATLLALIKGDTTSLGATADACPELVEGMASMTLRRTLGMTWE